MGCVVEGLREGGWMGGWRGGGGWGLRERGKEGGG